MTSKDFHPGDYVLVGSGQYERVMEVYEETSPAGKKYLALMCRDKHGHILEWNGNLEMYLNGAWGGIVKKLQKYHYFKTGLNYAMWLNFHKTTKGYVQAGVTFDAAVIFSCLAQTITEADEQFKSYHGVSPMKVTDISVMIEDGCNKPPISSAPFILATNKEIIQ